MTSPFFQLDKKERMLPDTPYYQPPQQQTGLNIPTSEPSPFNDAFFSSSSASAPPAIRTCATTRTTSHYSTSSSSCSSTYRNTRAEDKAAYKAQKRILKDQANLAKQQARSDAKQLKAERSLTQRQEKDLRHEIKHQAKQFKHEIKHQCKELKKELKHQHHAYKYGGQSYAVPSVPSVPGAPSVSSYASPPSQLVQSQPHGFYPQPVPVLVSSPLNQDLTVYDCSRGRARHGCHNRHYYSHTQHHNGGPLPVRLVHNVISRALTGVSNHLEQQVRHLQQERQQHEQQRTTVTVAPAPLLATSTSTPVMQYHPPAGPPPAPMVSGGDRKVGLQDPMLVYSMSNMSLGSSSSSSPASSSSSSSRPLPAMPVPHAIPRPDLVQQDQEQEEEDNAVPPPSYEDSFSTRRA
ncbi:hypothetical protein EC957_004621 [Mortierella hygrophila]|uniref:Uncharacterized protein n=1 Tax=Mortierella hygrophila TaxID=979708 RepID=A0A9P6F1D4_9FUNG|nr:hypothetical protein EC957_004621 [Mortierella hygrophila]